MRYIKYVCSPEVFAFNELNKEGSNSHIHQNILHNANIQAIYKSIVYLKKIYFAYQRPDNNEISINGQADQKFTTKLKK